MTDNDPLQIPVANMNSFSFRPIDDVKNQLFFPHQATGGQIESLWVSSIQWLAARTPVVGLAVVQTQLLLEGGWVEEALETLTFPWLNEMTLAVDVEKVKQSFLVTSASLLVTRALLLYSSNKKLLVIRSGRQKKNMLTLAPASTQSNSKYDVQVAILSVTWESQHFHLNIKTIRVICDPFRSQ